MVHRRTDPRAGSGLRRQPCLGRYQCRDPNHPHVVVIGHVPRRHGVGLAGGATPAADRRARPPQATEPRTAVHSGRRARPPDGRHSNPGVPLSARRADHRPMERGATRGDPPARTRLSGQLSRRDAAPSSADRQNGHGTDGATASRSGRGDPGTAGTGASCAWFPRRTLGPRGAPVARASGASSLHRLSVRNGSPDGV
jgi:hypothetical protein